MMEKISKLRVPLFVLFIKYYYVDQIKRLIWVGHVVHIGEMRNAYKILVGKPEEKRRL
jgi:hypothetical protein